MSSEMLDMSAVQTESETSDFQDPDDDQGSAVDELVNTNQIGQDRDAEPEEQQPTTTTEQESTTSETQETTQIVDTTLMPDYETDTVGPRDRLLPQVILEQTSTESPVSVRSVPKLTDFMMSDQPQDKSGADSQNSQVTPSTTSTTETATKKAEVKWTKEIQTLFTAKIDANSKQGIENALRNLIDSMEEVKSSLYQMMLLLTKPGVDQRLQTLQNLQIETSKIQVQGISYQNKTGKFFVHVQYFPTTIQAILLEKVVFCGYLGCISAAVPQLATKSMELTELWSIDECKIRDFGQSAQSTYMCDKKLTEEPECLFFNMDCDYTVASALMMSVKVYDQSYVLVHSPLNGSRLQNNSQLSGNMIHLISLKKDNTITIDSRKIAVKGVQQTLPMVINTFFLTRTEIDQILIQRDPNLLHRWVNTGLIATITSVLVALVLTVLWKHCRRPKYTATRTQEETIQLSSILRTK